MARLTRRHLKKGKKHKTLKTKNENFKGGNSDEKKREGVFDMIGNKISDATSSAVNSVTDAGLKIVGLERINDENEKETKLETNKLEETATNVANEVSETTANIASNVTDVADKTSAAIIENVNEVLGSDAVKETAEQAAQDTAAITTELLGNFNEAIDNPEVKEEVKEALDNAGEVASVAVDAFEEPLNKAVDVTAEAAQKATSAAVSGAIKVGTDAMAAVPFWGAIIDLGKMINDGSRAASAVVEAGSEAVEVASDAFIDTKENFEKGLKELDEKKKMSQQISNRTTNSINQFENPTVMKGGNKTRRKLFKRKLKSKRVRFAI
jgi:hypothetical protein